jgi:inhibitor of KinA
MKRGEQLNYTFYPLSENAVLIHFGPKSQNLKVQTAAYQIESNPFIGFIELVIAYQTITIYYDPMKVNDTFPYRKVINLLDAILQQPDSLAKNNGRIVEIPVCYDKEFGLDLNEISSEKQMSVEELIELHSKVIYDVIFIGFAPGFPFLAGLDERLHFPRKSSPRLKVPQGSVGIAGKQTGIYPLESPGGWQIIGRTPVRLFTISDDQPTLLQTGDQVKFYPISLKEFNARKEIPWELL